MRKVTYILTGTLLVLSVGGYLLPETPEPAPNRILMKNAAGHVVFDHKTHAEKLGISLTDSCGMLPEASICGLVFIHKYAVYPEIRRVSYSQVADYAVRRGMTHGEARRFLGYLVE